MARNRLRPEALWVVYVVMMTLAMAADPHPLNVGDGLGPAALGGVYLLLLGYSLYCTRRENFFKSLQAIGALYWGRQVGIDLYIGLGLVLSVVYLHEGSLGTLALWAAPVLIFGNLATLPYLALHLDGILAGLGG